MHKSNNNNGAKKFSNGEQEKCNFSFLCYFCSFAFLCVSSHCFAFLTPASSRTHNNNPGLSLPSRRRRKPFQNRTNHLRALSRPLSLSPLTVNFCHCHLHSHHNTKIHTQTHIHIYVQTNKLARAYANLSKLKQPTYPYFLYSAHLFLFFYCSFNACSSFVALPFRRFAVYSFFLLLCLSVLPLTKDVTFIRLRFLSHLTPLGNTGLLPVCLLLLLLLLLPSLLLLLLL